MQVIIHAGAYGTEEDRLMKTLLRNKEDFLARGTSVPGPTKYRELLQDCIAAARAAPTSPDARDLLWDAILEDEDAERVILSNPYFFGNRREALDGQRLYPEAEERLRALQALFPDDALHLHMTVRSPAGFLPKLLDTSGPDRRSTVLENTNPAELRWSALMARLRVAVPDVPITLWCYEDMPLLYPQILRELGNLDVDGRVKGGLDMLASIMSREGMRRLRSYLQEHPDMPEAYRRRVFAAFLDKYALEDEIAEELDIPDWTPDYIDHIEACYDEDVEQLSRIPGVTLLMP